MNIFDSKNNLEWRDYLKILKRRIWYFVVPFIGVLPIGIYKTVSTVPIYESMCIVQVLPSSYRLLPSSIKQTLPGVSGESSNARGIIKKIFSTDFTRKLIQQLELNQRPEFIAEARATKATYPEKNLDEIIEALFVMKLKKYVRVVNLDLDIFNIKATYTEPDFAYDLAKTIANIYINEAFQRKMRSVQSALRFNDEQLAIFRQKLEQAEQDLEKFKRNLVSSQVENPNFSNASLQHFQRAIVAIDLATREKKDYLSYLESRLNTDEEAESYPITESIQQKLIRVDKKVAEMASLMKSFTWKSPEVISVNRKINDLREEIRIEIETIYKVKYQDVETQQRALLLERAITLVDIEIQNRKKEVLNATLATSQNTSQGLMLRKLEREVAVNRQVYNKFLQQSQGVQIEKAIAEADASNQFKILSPARKPLEPINAGIKMILLITLIAGCGLGTGCVYLKEFLDSSVRTVNEAESYFELPVIGVLPYLGYQTQFHGKRLMVLSIVGVVILGLGAFAAWYFKLHHILRI